MRAASRTPARQPNKCLVGYPTDMDLSYSPEDEAFRAEVRAWLEDNLTGDFAELRGAGRTRP